MQVGGRWRTTARQGAPSLAHEGPSAGAPGARSMRARPALPSGRALVGGFLVAVAMILAFTVASASRHAPQQRIVVARRSIEVGHRLEADDLRLEPAEMTDPVASQLFDREAAATGQLALVPIAAGGAITRSAVVDDGGEGPTGREFSFPVDQERAMNGRLRPGDSVDVLVTYGAGDTARTLMVAAGVRLLDITAAGKATLGSSGTVVVSVLLTDAPQVVRVAHASEVGSVTLVRATGTPPGEVVEPYLTPTAPPRGSPGSPGVAVGP